MSALTRVRCLQLKDTEDDEACGDNCAQHHQVPQVALDQRTAASRAKPAPIVTYHYANSLDVSRPKIRILSSG